jgi:hypothetical protein
MTERFGHTYLIGVRRLTVAEDEKIDLRSMSDFGGHFP